MTEPTDTALAPCPFCAGTDIGEDCIQTTSIDSSYSVYGCRGCGACFRDGDIAAWNRRPSGGAGEPTGWQSIETAPKDGTNVLLYHGGVKGAFYARDEKPRWWVDRWSGRSWWQAAPSAMPTHWMPLPSPPAALRAALDALEGETK